MDKLINGTWALRIIALLMACLLFISVNFNPITGESNSLSTPSKIRSEKVEGVPIEIYYDTANLVVRDVPKTVDVTLEGPKSIMISAKNQRDFEVYIDLSDPKIGVQTVPVKIKKLSDKLKATISTSYVTVDVQEKVTKESSVDIEINKNLLTDGYSAGEPTVKPTKVQITGAKDIIEQIVYVKATIGGSGTATTDIERQATVQAFDRDLNKLNVEINPKVVDVSVPVKSPSKTVNLRAVIEGDTPDGITIESVTFNPKEIVLYGGESALKKITDLEVPINVSNVNDNVTYEIPLNLSGKLVSSSIETVTATIVVNKEGTRTLKGIPITTTGLNEQNEVKFIGDSKVDLVVKGNEKTVASLKAADFTISANLSGLKEGKHEVDLQVKGPGKLTWSLSEEKVTIELTKKNTGE